MDEDSSECLIGANFQNFLLSNRKTRIPVFCSRRQDDSFDYLLTLRAVRSRKDNDVLCIFYIKPTPFSDFIEALSGARALLSESAQDAWVDHRVERSVTSVKEFLKILQQRPEGDSLRDVNLDDIAEALLRADGNSGDNFTIVSREFDPRKPVLCELFWLINLKIDYLQYTLGNPSSYFSFKATASDSSTVSHEAEMTPAGLPPGNVILGLRTEAMSVQDNHSTESDHRNIWLATMDCNADDVVLGPRTEAVPAQKDRSTESDHRCNVRLAMIDCDADAVRLRCLLTGAQNSELV